MEEINSLITSSSECKKREDWVTELYFAYILFSVLTEVSTFRGTVKMQSAWILLMLFQTVPKTYTWNNIKSNMLPFFFDLDVCHSKTCYKDAENLLSSMNTSVDPCVDFYEFACGGWLTKNKKPDSEPTWTQWETVMLKVEGQIQHILENNQTEKEINSMNIARQMYQSCINFGNTEAKNILELLKLLDELGGWPVIKPNLTNNEFWLMVVTKINSILNIQPLLNFHVSLNLYNTSENILYIDHPTFAFPQWILSNPILYKAQLKAYVQWIMSTILEIAKINNINISYNDVNHQVHEIVKFEIQVASLISTNNDRNITNMYKKMTINQLQLWTDLISSTTSKTVIWTNVMKTLVSNYNITIDNEDYIIVKDIVYLLELIKLCERTSPKIVANYLGWNIVKYFAKDTTNILQEFSFAIDTVLLGIEENLSRKHQCAIAIKNQMSLAISYEFLNKYVSEAAKTDIKIIMQNIKLILITTLNSLNWMDNTTKRHALEKAEAISYLVANPDYLKNVTFINEYYKDLKITDNNIKNIINWNKFTRKNEFKQLRTSLQMKKWYNTVTDVNAYYSVLENSIIIPAGLLQYPFYESKRLNALNYGAIGTILGHEFSHAFDNTGRQADKNGNIKQWWSTESLAKYTKSLQCFQEHFNKYLIEMLQDTFNKKIKTEISAQKTQDENIADVIGLKLAYEAHNTIKQNEIKMKLPQLEKYTADQLFFIAFANQWCELSNSEQILTEIMDGDHIPNKIRVLGVLSNSEEFNKAFKCDINLPMNPKKKCKLW